MILEYAKVREKARAPERANPSDAGLDVFHNPDKTSTVTLNPGDNAVLPTGIRFGVPHGFMLQVMNRSSMAAKKGLVVGAHCVDSGYDGEVFIDSPQYWKSGYSTLHPGDKIAQVVLVPSRAVSGFGNVFTGNLYDWYPITMSGRGDGASGEHRSNDISQELRARRRPLAL
jgi:dUTP pyrophosphatase